MKNKAADLRAETTALTIVTVYALGVFAAAGWILGAYSTDEDFESIFALVSISVIVLNYPAYRAVDFILGEIAHKVYARGRWHK